MTRLPLTVISGYLGAGKTTLINRLLAEDHGLRLLVLVNDFGAINIDQALIEQAGDDTIALTNGCVCCTMGADLFMALGDALDRVPRPDHLIIEASGIADPAAIANAAIAEPDLSYAGIITLVDGLNGGALLDDSLIAPQVAQQITAADLVLLTKTDTPDPAFNARLTALPARNLTQLSDDSLAPLLFDLVPLPRGGLRTAPHPAYASWQHDSDRIVDRRAMGTLLENRPDGLYRLKGFVQTDDGAYEVHVVGRYVHARRAQADRTVLVGLGPADRITTDQIEAWWTGA
ncbi:CobW family GTP-binding protein [Phaeobacter marinintestinus]|uniref:CobW family GTP-binding protein n=1 Tax=Falsiphaeobacter marinintestinus TaxID=1492905 RepID=UPI0011B6CCC0|nr:CobW family GTP-binding protein [Phaeobacter marinintestinus]